MYFPDDDDETIVGPSSFVTNDADLPNKETTVGNTFWTAINDIWGAITNTLDAMNDPFAADDYISDDDANTAFAGIKTAYEEMVKTELDKYDNETDSCEYVVPEIIFSYNTPPVNDTDRDATYTGESQLTNDSQGASQVESQLTTSQDASQFDSQVASQFDPSTEKAAPPPTPSTYKSMIESRSDAPPPSPYKTIGVSSAQSICDTVATRNTLDSGVSRGTIKNKSILPIIEEVIREEEYESDSMSEANKLELQSVGTSVLSGLFKAQKMNVGELLATGDASKVYKLIANILYKQNVAIDVRDGSSRGKSNEGQMREVWGSVITDYAKSDQAKCYLCGGQIVPCKRGTSAGGARQGGQPEMEHKLPCAVFYAKFAFIYSCFADELVAWRTYVANLDEDSLLMDYYILMNSNDADFNRAALDTMYKTISADFLTSLNGSKLDETNLGLFVNFVLPAYLSEFAYSHHLCNQLKSNHDLSDTTKLQNYYEGLVAILNLDGTECIKTASKKLQAACINDEICIGERDAIIAGLFPTKTGAITSRTENVREQNVYLQDFATKYAEKSQTTEKRMILHTIKETIRTMKVPIPKNGKVTKKAARQMNAQARIIAQGLTPITKEVRYFLNTMAVLLKGKTDRNQKQAEDKLRVQLDRTRQIFENVYDTPNNIVSQLKNAYISPDIKARIYTNAKAYCDTLSAILVKVKDNIKTLAIRLEEDDTEMLDECTDVVNGLNSNLTKYADKQPGVRALGEAEAVGQGLGQAQAPKEMNLTNFMNISGRLPAPALPPAIATFKGTLNPRKKAEAKARREPEIDETPKKITTIRGLDMDEGDLDEINGGKKQRRKKTRKINRRHQKTTKRARVRKFTMKYKYISKKNTRRR